MRKVSMLSFIITITLALTYALEFYDLKIIATYGSPSKIGNNPRDQRVISLQKGIIMQIIPSPQAVGRM